MDYVTKPLEVSGRHRDYGVVGELWENGAWTLMFSNWFTRDMHFQTGDSPDTEYPDPLGTIFLVGCECYPYKTAEEYRRELEGMRDADATGDSLAAAGELLLPGTPAEPSPSGGTPQGASSSASAGRAGSAPAVEEGKDDALPGARSSAGLGVVHDGSGTGSAAAAPHERRRSGRYRRRSAGDLKDET